MAQVFSLHPSWDRMYLSGMTVQEIADYTGRARSTVHRHLQVRQRYSDDFRAVHEAARAARGPDWPTTRWQRRYKAVQDFHTARGRLPDPKDSSELATWLNTQRSLHSRELLPAIKVTLMDIIPDWDARPHQKVLDERWHTRLTQLQAHVSLHGHWPRYRRHTTEQERVLGVWLHTQHQARAEGRLLGWRMNALDAALPGWHSTL